MNNLILIGGFIDGIRFRKDKSAILYIETQELDREQKSNIGSLGGDYLYLALRQEAFNSNEQKLLEDMKADKPKRKSKSETLRQIVYRLWESEHTDITFTEFYENQMDKFITQVRDKLNEQY